MAIWGRQLRSLKVYILILNHVFINGELSNKKYIVMGACQVCLLCLILFLLFINDLLHYLDEKVPGIKIAQQNIIGLLYADDVVIVTNSVRLRSSTCTEYIKYCYESSFEVNVNKINFYSY